MERQTSDCEFHEPDPRPATPRRARSRSQGLGGNHGTNADHDGEEGHRIHPGQFNGRVPRRPSHLRASSYTSHLRSRSAGRISLDGRVAVPTSRTPSRTPPQSPVRRSNRPRPLSAISLPDHAFGRPTVLTNRWSYDRDRMPSPRSPPPAHASRPGTPLSEHGDFEMAFSRPSSTFIESRPSSRPQSILLSASTDLGFSSHNPSTPTLRVIPPPDYLDREGQPQPQPQRQQHSRQSYHVLTDDELEMLSRPPPVQPPMTPSASPTLSPRESAPRLTSEISHLGPPRPKEKHHHAHANDGEEVKGKPGCLGLCEIATAGRVAGKFGAWFMGMMIPVTFGLVTGCIATVTSCR